MLPRMPGHIYFDLDGTLTDPYEGITRCILYALDELGFPRPDDEYLESIAAAGHTMFVATAKPHMHAARIIEHFGMGELIHNVYGSELDGTRATKTDLLKFALEKNPGTATRIMIGDRRHDLAGAIANDLLPVGVAWGYGSLEELETAGATAIAHSPAQLVTIVARLATS